MDSQDHRRGRADRIFDAALELDARARAELLDRECGDDRDLRSLVERLLAGAAADDPLLAPGGLMQGPLWRGLVDEMSGEAGLAPGTLLGRWRILGEIGRGGMAVVHLAERADGHFAQRAAVKLVKRGADSAEVVGRFEQERQILASFAHPGIARLLDGGVGPDGRPYFVLEHVEGRPIDVYCDERRLTVRARLRLFLQVARAVEHAHRNLVVHRDIKPSNILVTEDGQAKLLDFGIARLMDGSSSVTLTHGRQRPMTPAYASPEQLRGEAITTASDVYQLGLLLYLLLTGRRAHGPTEGSGAALQAAILEKEPTRPSAVIAEARAGHGSPVPSEQVAGARSTTPARLARALDGDLDNVVMKALRKEPERRYADVGHLIDDIESHLAGRPVGARPDTVGYRLGKFARRHWLAVTAAALVVASLGAGLMAAAHQARRAQRRFDQVRALARDLLFEVDEEVARLPGSTRARERIVAASLEYLGTLEAEAGADAGLLRELAEAYEKVGDVQGFPRSPNLGQRRAALASYERALALHGRLGSASSGDPALRRALARVHVKVGDVHETEARLADALASLEAGLALARPLQARPQRESADFALVVDALVTRGGVQARANDARAALGSYREALALATAWDGEHPGLPARRALAQLHRRIGSALAETGDVAGSVAAHRRALAMTEELARRDPQDVALRRELRVALSFLANVLGVPGFMNLGQTSEAESLCRRALALSLELAEADPRDTRAAIDLSSAHWRLGSLVSKRDPLEGERLLRQALAGLTALGQTGPRDFDVRRREAAVRLSLGDALRERGDLAAAAAELRTVLDTAGALAAGGTGDVETRAIRRSAHRRLAEVLMERRDFAGARASEREFLRLAEEWTREKPDDLYARWALADSYACSGRLARARALDPQDPPVARLEAARASAAWHRNALAIWTGWAARVPSTAFDQAQRAEAEAAVAEADALARRLEGPTPASAAARRP